MDDFEVPTFEFSAANWMSQSLCARLDEDTADRMFFPERGGSGNPARRLCARCPVIEQCLEYALNNKENFGIWGGTSERERRGMRRNRWLAS